MERCKGACCTLKGAGGAPLLDEEIEEIRSNVSIVRKYLEKENLKIIDKHKFFDGSSGDFSLKSVDDEACVFSFFENGIAKCAFQRAYDNGETKFRKPISCHLFPIRISGHDRNILKYEELDECEPALKKGIEMNSTIYEFAREPLIREYGAEFYEGMKSSFGKDYLKKE